MGAHERLKFEPFKKKEASDVHERLKFKFSKYGHKRLSHIQKICVLIKQSNRFPTRRVKSLKMFLLCVVAVFSALLEQNLRTSLMFG